MRLAQSLGFTLVEIEADLPLLTNPDASGKQLRAALSRKLLDIDRRISNLQTLRDDLARRLMPDMEQCPLRSSLEP